VRAFLLVKDGVAFCSSATGAMNTPLVQLIPHIDTRKAVDMRSCRDADDAEERRSGDVGTQSGR
jgi:hypothetical protein